MVWFLNQHFAPLSNILCLIGIGRVRNKITPLNLKSNEYNGKNNQMSPNPIQLRKVPKHSTLFTLNN